MKPSSSPACSSARSNRDRPRTHLPATPSPPYPPVNPSQPSPLHPSPPPPHAHSPTSRGMMMGLPLKGHSLRRVHQPGACRQGATVAAAPRRWNPLDALSRVEEGVTSTVVTPSRTVVTSSVVTRTPYRMWPGLRPGNLVGGDTVEHVVRTRVLAPPDPTRPA